MTTGPSVEASFALMSLSSPPSPESLAKDLMLPSVLYNPGAMSLPTSEEKRTHSVLGMSSPEVTSGAAPLKLPGFGQE